MRYNKEIAYHSLPNRDYTFDQVTKVHEASTLHIDRIKPKEGSKVDVIMCERMKRVSRNIGRIKSPLRMSVKDRRSKYSK